MTNFTHQEFFVKKMKKSVREQKLLIFVKISLPSCQKTPLKHVESSYGHTYQ
jgi:hypothetical protein